ncbi:MAG: helix-turn-helix domain-containing protein [Nitrospirae bacterium]|nr:helix-turn-helix domain-containing protein [Nitrospirota bacterium]
MRNIGSRLKHFRDQLGLSQLELSQKSGISQASIARIEANQQKNLKTATIEKLASALEVPILHLLEEAPMVREEKAPYQTSRMLPVIKADEFIKAKGNMNKVRTSSFEPSLSTDPQAFFLLSTDIFSGIASITLGDLLLIEPMAKIQDGDISLILSKNKIDIARLYHRINVCIIQPLRQASEPFIVECKKRQKRDVRMFRVGEIRKKY